MKKLLILLLITTFLIGGCSNSNTTEATEEQVLQAITIGVMPDVGATPFMLAKENGYYEDLGLDVTIEVFRSAMDRDTALQTGNLDGVMSDMLSVIFFNDNDFNVKITSGTYGNFRMVTSPANKDLTIKDLTTESIGLSTNTVIEFATDYILESYDITTAEKVAVPKIPLRLEMLRTGELDIATLPEPLASAAMLEGGTVLRDTSDLQMNPGIFIFSQDAIDQKSAEITALYTGYNKAVDYMNETPIDTYFSLLVENLGFPPVLEGQFEMPEMSHAAMPNRADFKFVLKWMNEKELSDAYYILEDVSTDQFVTVKEQ